MDPTLRQWKTRAADEILPLFSCARPGRSAGRSVPVPDHIVSMWVSNLPGVPNTTIVSLLGAKPNGKSEFAFYSFRGGWDATGTPGAKPTFKEWLAQHHADFRLELVEHPTIDKVPIPDEVLTPVIGTVQEVLRGGRTVVLVDSGGVQRTGFVCRRMGLVPVAPSG